MEANQFCEDLLGKVVNNEQEAYDLYCKHAYRTGFSVRKGKNYYYSGTKNLRSKEYVCSKEGFKNDEPQPEVSFSKLDSRTGCKAMIVFSIDKEGLWKVTRFINDHNHEFASPAKRHFLRSARDVSARKGDVLKSMVNAGIRPIHAYSFMAQESGGAENLGYTKKDSFNFISTLKRIMVEVGDSQSVINHFKQKVAEEDGMFWDVQHDEDGRLTNIFWRDGRSRVDYDYFGDVVVFDTTYRTNKYNLVCAPFVGVNHHWQNVMFGCAFLHDETGRTFEWLFKTFILSMGNQCPKTIFTDQDAAMASAIHKVLPNTRHRICLWHISKNAPSHLGGLISNHTFRNLFNSCLQGCDTEEEFEIKWKKLVCEYTDGSHKWLNNLYDLRQKWCTALNKDVFDCGIISSQRVESTNNVLNGIAKSTTSLIEFVHGFEKLVHGWRQNEAQEDFRCHQGAPTHKIKNCSILKHAGKVYTHKIYQLFELEYLAGCCATSIQETAFGDNLCKFECVSQGEKKQVFVVQLDTSAKGVSCTCKKFETLGILCSHILGVLNRKSIPEIPEHYILKRWTKEAKTRIRKYCHVKATMKDANDSGLVFRNHAMRYAYDMVTMAQENEKMQEVLWSLFDDGYQKLQGYRNNLPSDISSKGHISSKNNNKSDQPLLLDPIYVKTKGTSNARFKGHFEKRKAKSISKEKGTYSNIMLDT